MNTNNLLKACITTLLLAIASTASSQTYFQHPWQGKRVAYFGDSITDPKNNGSKKKYWNFLNEWLDITPYVYARSGRQWNDIPRQAGLLKQEHGSDVDAIIIFMGTNDYNQDVPLGEWFSEKYDTVYYAHGGATKHLEIRRHRTPTMTMETLRGRINIALDSVKRTWPDKQVVLLTPIHRAGFFPNEKNWQPEECYANGLGLYIDDYANVVKEAANVWAVPVVDLNAQSGLFPMIEPHGMYFHNDADHLHPNDAGHQRMAQTLMYALVSLPCSFAGQ